MKICYLGNFSVPYSTESHLKWTWEKLGHTVVPIQETASNNVGQVLEACRDAQIFEVSHTHSWSIRGDMDDMMQRIKAMGVKTMSYHLDVYCGLNQWDRREERVGKTWDWKVDYFFSTEGARGEFFKSHGVNWHYMPPGVVEYGCFEGIPRLADTCDVLFTGSINYHPEYPFRPRMVKALQERYGTRFRVVQGVREKALNDLYASAKVVVGDHCFAGVPCYWSDRLPEACGRGAFLLYPRTEGMTIPTATYNPQDIGDLIGKIDYFLSHDAEREEIRKRAYEHVKNHDTYTHRLSEILQVMNA